jgi:hypothetical protein
MPAKPSTKTPAKTPAKVGTKATGHAPVSDQDRIISLAAGKYAYIIMADSTSRHLATSNPVFIETLETLAEAGYANKILSQLHSLANANPESPWPGVLAAYEAARSPE